MAWKIDLTPEAEAGLAKLGTVIETVIRDEGFVLATVVNPERWLEEMA